MDVSDDEARGKRKKKWGGNRGKEGNVPQKNAEDSDETEGGVGGLGFGGGGGGGSGGKKGASASVPEKTEKGEIFIMKRIYRYMLKFILSC